MKKFLILMALCGLMLSGCESRHGASEAMYDMGGEEVVVEAEMIAASPESAATEAVPTDELPKTQKIIKTGRMGIRVARIAEAKRRVDSLTAVYRGYYADENYNDGYRFELTLTIRVPFAQFDAFTAALEAGKGEVLYKNISARDIGEEYLDTEIRLANKRGYLERYREILRRANTIKEIMEVEQYVRRLEEEIESAQGRLRYLDNQASYSTLVLTLSTEQIAVPDRDSFWSRLKEAFSTGWSGIVTFFIGLVYLWPLLLIGGVVWALIAWHIKRRKERKEKTAPDRF
jgi:hypothetical protein